MARQNQCAAYTDASGTPTYEQHVADSSLVLSAKTRGLVPERFLGAGSYSDPGGDPLGAVGLSLGCARAIGLSDPGIVFLHERRTPRGQPLIVAITLVPTREISGYPGGFMAQASYAVPASRRPGSRAKWNSDGMVWSMIVHPQEDFRAFMGVPDATESTRFSIPYELDGQPGIIDGYVRDELGTLNGDGAIMLVARTGPAVPRSQPNPMP